MSAKDRLEKPRPWSRTLGKYMFFQHFSHKTPPPSTDTHFPSSIFFSHRTQILGLRGARSRSRSRVAERSLAGLCRVCVGFTPASGERSLRRLRILALSSKSFLFASGENDRSRPIELLFEVVSRSVSAWLELRCMAALSAAALFEEYAL
jgi:hypothetical protein